MEVMVMVMVMVTAMAAEMQRTGLLERSKEIYGVVGERDSNVQAHLLIPCTCLIESAGPGGGMYTRSIPGGEPTR